ncbi:PA14 domain-containing protein, partial [Bacillus thuringiensis]|uniref:binary toxin-like calcium binding domain-containing protein n=1 Tax=Bacillus thuringiensis TaxID=1428 RepID=UPI003457C094
MKKKTVLPKLALSMMMLATSGPLPYNVFAEEVSTSDETQKENKTEKEGQLALDSQKHKNNGLLGYYFNDDSFQKLSFIQESKTGKMGFSTDSIGELAIEDTKHQSVHWNGYVQVDTDGEYTFQTPANEHVQMWVNGQKVIDKSSPSTKIVLEKNRLYAIQIQYTNDSVLGEFSLSWIKPDGNNEIVPVEALVLPTGVDQETNDTAFSTDTTPLSLLDTDKDGIPDALEIDGYAVQKVGSTYQIVSWSPVAQRKGLIKYKSSPDTKYTAGDPFSDYDKVMQKIDPMVAKEAHNPLVAAVPRVNAEMEQFILSKNKDISTSSGGNTATSLSRNTSASRSNETAVGITASVEASFGIGSASVSTSVSASLNMSSTVSNTIENGFSDSAEKNWAETIGIKTGEAAYVGAMVRYANRGTAPMYNVTPSIQLNIANQAIEGLKATDQEQALILNPNASYPQRGTNGLLFRRAGQERESFISISQNQLNELQRTQKIGVQTLQVDGKVGVKEADSSRIVPKHAWTEYINSIDSATSRLLLVTPEGDVDRNIAAKNPERHSSNRMKEVTLEESLDLAFQLKKIKGQNGKIEKITYQEWEFTKFHIIMDAFTEKEGKKQGYKDFTQDISQMKMRPDMKIMIAPIGWVKNIQTGKQYYYNDKGVLQTGKQTLHEKTYYFTEKGEMKTGWFDSDNKKYYFGQKDDGSGLAEGQMATGKIVIQGTNHVFEKDGTWSKNADTNEQPD